MLSTICFLLSPLSLYPILTNNITLKPPNRCFPPLCNNFKIFPAPPPPNAYLDFLQLILEDFHPPPPNHHTYSAFYSNSKLLYKPPNGLGFHIGPYVHIASKSCSVLLID